MKQVDIWRDSEGDAWHRRNAHKIPMNDRVLELLAWLQENNRLPVFKRALEIGCGTGARLRALTDIYHCESTGIDISQEAVKLASAHDHIHVTEGRADLLEFTDNSFDLVIFGFVLYACDPDLFFPIVAEADRVLVDGGILVIHDFHAVEPHSRKYTHDTRLRTHKMDFSRLFLGHPFYRLTARRVFGTEHNHPISDDDAVAVTVIRKDASKAFPMKEWEA